MKKWQLADSFFRLRMHRANAREPSVHCGREAKANGREPSKHCRTYIK